jgi:hypothetical protein
MHSPFLQPLHGDRFDIIGDVHGEIDALRALLRHLGCDPERGTVDRPLVFVGDLVDRGPDSVAVVELVAHLVASGVAQVVLGNHELSLLSGESKEGNGWFGFCDEGNDTWHEHGERHPYRSRQATPSEQQRIRSFLGTLPLALEGPTLRVVHAAWDAPALDWLRQQSTLADVLRGMSAERAPIPGAPTEAELLDEHWKGAYHHEFAIADADAQNANPTKRLTSGPEHPLGVDTKMPYLSGKWRMVDRKPWWLDDDDERPVVFGHYWRERWRTEGNHGPLHGVHATTWLGRHQQAFCVDYSVGKRFKARHHGERHGAAPLPHALAAMRMPERKLFFDDGWHPAK